MQQGIPVLFLSLLLLVTTSCGFHPHDNGLIYQKMQMLILESPDLYGPLAQKVRWYLRLNGVVIFDKKSLKENVPSLCILNSSESQEKVSIFRDGKIAEHQILIKVQAQVLIPGYNPYQFEVNAFRSFFDRPLTALAKNSEQETIHQEMLDHIAQQLVRKLLQVYEKAEKKS